MTTILSNEINILEKYRAKAIMILGTTSGAGKSWLTTALCRYYSNLGYKVAFYKAQNMSNNARVVSTHNLTSLDAGLGEMGSAQYFQALSARCIPDVRMNPVLLKPESDTSSQVVVMGKVTKEISMMPWLERAQYLWPYARDALHSLMDEYDVVIIEGAGSPAEINLRSTDYVNMKVALEVNAACLLVTDIDRGGSFAHLYGTYQLLPENERRLIKGFVLNRFRGDPELLKPGPEMLEKLTGVPTVAVIPIWREHGLPEEDGVYDLGAAEPTSASPRRYTIGIIAFPHISNLDEYQSLVSAKSLRVLWVREARLLDQCDMIILPGSKCVIDDLQWLKGTPGLSEGVITHHEHGKRVLGICGGYQMLGCFIIGEEGIEGVDGKTQHTGLGLLCTATFYERDKCIKHTTFAFANNLPAPWSELSLLRSTGYEIHYGQTVLIADLNFDLVDLFTANDNTRPFAYDYNGQVLGHVNRSAAGVYVHGLFEGDGRMLRALFGTEGTEIRALDEVIFRIHVICVPLYYNTYVHVVYLVNNIDLFLFYYMQQVFEGLAAFVEPCFSAGLLQGLLLQTARLLLCSFFDPCSLI